MQSVQPVSLALASPRYCAPVNSPEVTLLVEPTITELGDNYGFLRYLASESPAFV